MSKRSPDPIGKPCEDSFFDCYRQEALELCEMMELLDKTPGDTVRITFTKDFLKKLIHSRLRHITELQKDIEGRTYSH